MSVVWGFPESPSQGPTATWVLASYARSSTLRIQILDAIHRLLAYAAVVGVVAGIAWSIVLLGGQRTGGPRFERFQASVVALLVVEGAAGLIMLASGARPREDLHLLYALIAVALIPLARSFLTRTSGRAPSVFLLVAFIVLGAVVYRLFTTG